MKDEFKEIKVISSLDNSVENNLFFFPTKVNDDQKIPLVVCLHTWSFDRFNQVGIIEFCKKRNWALLLPEFRGNNCLTNPRAEEACGSEVACNDIIDAVEFLQSKYSIEPNAVFLLGGSGGGHMALMVAAYKTTMWRAVSSWCPITDLALWHKKNGENNGYTPHIEACCGGAPGDSHKVDYEYVKRSPMSYLTQLTKVNLCIHHGRFDKTVPYIHTKNLAFALDALSPPSFFFEIFDGGHDFFPERAFTWFDKILSSKDHKMALTS